MSIDEPKSGDHISNYPNHKVTVDGDVVDRDTGHKVTQTGGATVKADERGDLYT